MDGEGVAGKQLLPTKVTEVLLKFCAILPMMHEYAKPLLLPATR